MNDQPLNELSQFPPHTPGYRSGSVAIVGRPNVGKSTLLNRLVGDKVAIVSPIAQTTRHRILGVRTLEAGQIAFVDTPGLHKPHHQLGAVMNDLAVQAVDEVDAVVIVLEGPEGITASDRHVLEQIKRSLQHRPALIALNKIDSMNKGRLLPLIEELRAAWPEVEVVPISATSGDNCDRLIELLLERLPEGPPLYPTDYVSDQGERKVIAETIREKLLEQLRQEVPHAIAVVVERMEQREDGLVTVDATIFVERPSQKAIVIGAGGSMLKRVGTHARKELEQRFDRHLFLRLWVKVKEDWRDRVSLLRELGVLP